MVYAQDIQGVFRPLSLIRALLVACLTTGCSGSFIQTVESARTEQAEAQDDPDNSSEETSSTSSSAGSVSISGPYTHFASSGSVTITGSCEDGATITASGDVSGSPSTTCSSGSFSLEVSLAGADGNKSVTITNSGSSASVTLTVRKSYCAQASGYAGNGDDASPYLICSLEQLNNIRDDTTAVYRLEDDVYAASTSGWNNGEGFTPIPAFTGKLLGNSKTIYDLTLKPAASPNQGMFATANGATFSNLTMENVSLACEQTCGALIGLDTGSTISGINISGNIIEADAGSTSVIGGLVGQASTSTISGSHFSGSLKTGSAVQVGGLIGFTFNGASVSDSSSSGSLEGCTQYCGGLIGQTYTSTVDDSYSSMDVNTPLATYSGGLVGTILHFSNATVLNNLYATGDVTAFAGAGGLIGEYWAAAGATLTLNNCYATGRVEASNTWAGGAFGSAKKTSSGVANINNCFATGEVTSPGIEGGLVGISDTVNWSNNHYYNHAGNPASCVGSITAGTAPCTSNGTLSDFYNSGNAPLSSWTFPGDWVTTATFPVLSWE